MKSKGRMLLVAVVIFLSLVAWTGYGQRPKAISSPQRWEYTSRLGDSELNLLGSDGWELVVVTTPPVRPDGTQAPALFYFKRAR